MPDEARLFERMIEHLELPSGTTRRGFLMTTVGAAVSLPVIRAWAAGQAKVPVVILDNAEGMIVSDSTRCVGCKRCELACTEFNEGRSQPSLARVKVSRNYNFGARGQQAGTSRGMGEFGNLRLVQDTCLQCPHPVPCASACAQEAIVTDPKTKARVVNAAKCIGCRMCLRACPWEMITFDDASSKASKCFLCSGQPECVAACPTRALRYVSWRDLTRAVPARQPLMPLTRDFSSACGACHSTRRKP
jgi:Fe-S-cluster-containing dehydrogenase component